MKYNLTQHDTTNQFPYTMWHEQAPKIFKLHIFGQVGTIPHYAPKTKLETRADPARYPYDTLLTHVPIVNFRANQRVSIRTEDFKPYHRETDSTAAVPSPFRTVHREVPLPRAEITTYTSPPRNLKQGRRYLDAQHWQKGHDREPDNLDKHNSTTWLP